MAAYKDPTHAEKRLTGAFNPTNDAQKKAIADAAALVPGGSSSATDTSTSSTPSPYYSRYTKQETAADNYLNTFKAPETEEGIIERKTAAAQGAINSLNKHYDSLLAEQGVINEGRDRSTQSVNVMSGLAGSTEANVHQQKTTALNQRDNAKIQNERNVAIQSIFSDIRKSAVEEAKQSRLEAREGAEGVLANRTKRQEAATKNLTMLAKTESGATLAGLKASLSEEEYNSLVDNAGGEAMASAILFENRPRNQVLGTPQLIGGKMVQAFTAPDGRVLYESIALPEGVVPDNILSVEKTDNGIFIIKKDGTYSRVTGSGKIDGGGAGGDQLYSGLTSATATAVRSRVNKYASEPMIQNFATIQDGYNFAKSIDTKTTNPADDQALIYSLAKTLDPGSVVREGEYATAQKYAQSWVQAYGKGVTQALLGTGFLSESARTNIKNTIEQKYKSSKTSYDQVNNSYVKGINALTGRNDADQFLTDYVVPTSSPTANSGKLIGPAGELDISELTQEEYDEAIADGYKQQ